MKKIFYLLIKIKIIFFLSIFQSKSDTFYYSGGCFWCTEQDFEADAFEADVRKIVRSSFLSDCMFLYSPGQIALAALELSCSHTSSPWNRLLPDFQKFADSLCGSSGEGGYERSSLRGAIDGAMSQITSSQQIPTRDTIVRACAAVSIRI